MQGCFINCRLSYEATPLRYGSLFLSFAASVTELQSLLARHGAGLAPVNLARARPNVGFPKIRGTI